MSSQASYGAQWTPTSAELRYEAMHLTSADAIGQWIGKAMVIGLDPL